MLASNTDVCFLFFFFFGSVGTVLYSLIGIQQVSYTIKQMSFSSRHLLSVTSLGKAREYGPSVWNPCHPHSHMGDLDETPAFWSGPVLAIKVNWGMVQQMKDSISPPTHPITQIKTEI